MKKMIVFLFVFFMSLSALFCQVNQEMRLPDFFKFWHESPEFIYGNVKELHIKSFDAIQRDGEIVKVGNVISGSNWAENASYYFNANGQLIQSNIKFSNGDWIGTFNYEDDRLISINWLNDNVYK